MFRYLILGIAVTASVICYQLWTRNFFSPESNVQTSSVEPSSNPARQAITSTERPTEAPVASSDPDDPVDLEPEPLFDRQTTAQTELDAWEAEEEPKQLPERFLRKGIDARPLKLNKASLRTTGVGDSLKLPIPQTGNEYEMEVQTVGRHPNGDKSLRGHLVNTDHPYSVIMTEGAKSTYATINTPEGSYMLEAKGDAGWIMAVAELETLIDPNLSDYQIPDS